MKRIHLICHTHWDREWHKTFEEFRVRLVVVMEQIIEMLEKNKIPFFSFDGQTVVLEDYLQVNPEDEERIKRLVSEGRLFVGPWYTQPDEFLVSGESIVRNLLIGMAIARRFGKCMNVGYLPDSFGQAAQIPQIMKKIGLDRVIVWRGIALDEINTARFYWESPNKQVIDAIHLPLGYGYNRYLPFNREEAYQHIKATIQKIESRFPGNDILLMSGSDHATVHPTIMELIPYINQRLKEEGIEAEVELSNFEKAADAILSPMNFDFPLLKGELRRPKDMRIHAGISSTRMDIKYENKQSEILLERFVEPIKIFEYLLSLIYSNRYMSGGGYPNHIINQAWKYLLQNQCHDSICCCCIDDVHQEIQSRFKKIKEISKALFRITTKFFEINLNTTSLIGNPILVFNTLPYRRDDLIIANIYTSTGKFRLLDGQGREIPYEVVNIRDFDLSTLNINQAMKGRRLWVKEANVVFKANCIPAGGYQVLQAVESETRKKAESNLTLLENGMENEKIRVLINPNGSFSIVDKRTGREYRKLHIFEDMGDSGDEYNYSPPLKDRRITSEDIQADISLESHNRFAISYKISYLLRIPTEINWEENSRSDEKIDCLIQSIVTLKDGSDLVEVKTTINNKSKNHRLRVLFPSSICSSYSYAEDHFGVINRDNNIKDSEKWKEKKYNEKPLPIYPQQSFVDLSDNSYGLAILNKGLTEYEILDDSIIALTLLRAIGHVGRPNLVIRPGRVSGIELEAPESQMQGLYTFEYAILPHVGTYEDGDVVRKARLFNTPCKVEQIMETRDGGGCLPHQYSFIEIQSKGLEISSIKKAESGDMIIIRIYNSSRKEIKDGIISLHVPNIKRVALANLKEEPIIGCDLIKTEVGYLLPTINPFEVVTICFELHK